MRKAQSGVLFLFLILLLLSACQGAKQAVYFKNDDAPDSTVLTTPAPPQPDAIIEPNDILAINIASLSFVPDDKPSLVFLNGGLVYSQGNTGSMGGGGTLSSSNTGTAVANSYLVDSAGFIDYPRVGRLKMAGLSINAAKIQMANLLKDYLKSPTVEIRIVNYRITMLGEVDRPGPIYTTNHKMTILDAIATSGGIPITGRKDNILVIREVDGKREFARVDLNSKNIFYSPYYYLHQNDIVYVEPSGVAKQEGNEFLRVYLPNIMGMMSLIFSAAAVITLAK
jgi:polysaccharide export outer membrane protein